MSDQAPFFRQVARIVVLDPARRILLLRYELRERNLTIWANPGGGLEPGESFEQAAVRELKEELDLVVPALGPCIWLREFVYPLRGRPCRQLERFYLCEVPAFEPPALGRPDLIQDDFLEYRWWTQEEFRSTSGATFAPRKLPSLLERLFAEGPPPEPIDVGL